MSKNPNLIILLFYGLFPLSQNKSPNLSSFINYYPSTWVFSYFNSPINNKKVILLQKRKELKIENNKRKVFVIWPLINPFQSEQQQERTHKTQTQRRRKNEARKRRKKEKKNPLLLITLLFIHQFSSRDKFTLLDLISSQSRRFITTTTTTLLLRSIFSSSLSFSR
jgi:hypothetical protein